MTLGCTSGRFEDDVLADTLFLWRDGAGVAIVAGLLDSPELLRLVAAATAW